jgi:hypothetical protein
MSISNELRCMFRPDSLCLYHPTFPKRDVCEYIHLLENHVKWLYFFFNLQIRWRCRPFQLPGKISWEAMIMQSGLCSDIYISCSNSACASAGNRICEGRDARSSWSASDSSITWAWWELGTPCRIRSNRCGIGWWWSGVSRNLQTDVNFQVISWCSSPTREEMGNSYPKIYASFDSWRW